MNIMLAVQTCSAETEKNRRITNLVYVAFDHLRRSPLYLPIKEYLSKFLCRFYSMASPHTLLEHAQL